MPTTAETRKAAKDAAAATEAEASAKREADRVAGPPYYCPGCGRRWNYMTDCTGMNAAVPHPPIEVVSTDELAEGADPEDHTPAPATNGG